MSRQQVGNPLEKSGKKSGGKRNRDPNTRHFMITDHSEKGNVSVEHCNADEMVAEFMTKGSQFVKFVKFGDVTMGFK